MATARPATGAIARGSVQMHFDEGVHAATLRPLLHENPGATCGGCAALTLLVRRDSGERLKCARAVSLRRGPNIRPEFPACDGYAPANSAPGGPPVVHATQQTPAAYGSVA